MTVLLQNEDKVIQYINEKIPVIIIEKAYLTERVAEMNVMLVISLQPNIFCH